MFECDNSSQMPSNIVHQQLVRQAYSAILEESLDQDPPILLGQFREPGLHLTLETLRLRGTCFFFLQEHQQPGEVICARRGLCLRKCILERADPPAHMSARLQMPDQR